ncbi:MAG: hypothetical protein JW774_09340 [Candidatus Aureabacteria bacterium]|nr:hypothetical protein [Candidatus Auribacterota bacterium]
MDTICDIRIIPEKEKETAIISFTLNQRTWIELDAVYQNLMTIIPHRSVLSHLILADKMTLQLLIQYLDQEMIMKTAINLLEQQPGMKVGRKQIFIKKLGGWFDV